MHPPPFPSCNRTLTATSVNDTSKSSTATITVTAAAGAAAVSVTMTDTPPAGVTLLSFEVSVTGATLNPGSVDLLGGKGPIQIEVKQLETESAFLSHSYCAQRGRSRASP